MSWSPKEKLGELVASIRSALDSEHVWSARYFVELGIYLFVLVGMHVAFEHLKVEGRAEDIVIVIWALSTIALIRTLFWTAMVALFGVIYVFVFLVMGPPSIITELLCELLTRSLARTIYSQEINPLREMAATDGAGGGLEMVEGATLDKRGALSSVVSAMFDGAPDAARGADSRDDELVVRREAIERARRMLLYLAMRSIVTLTMMLVLTPVASLSLTVLGVVGEPLSWIWPDSILRQATEAWRGLNGVWRSLPVWFVMMWV
jgi:hypothetical protein